MAIANGTKTGEGIRAEVPERGQTFRDSKAAVRDSPARTNYRRGNGMLDGSRSGFQQRDEFLCKR